MHVYLVLENLISIVVFNIYHIKSKIKLWYIPCGIQQIYFRLIKPTQRQDLQLSRSLSNN